MILIDTSVWIHILSDKQGKYSQKLYQEIAERETYLTHFQQLELLQGCKSQIEFDTLADYLDDQSYLEINPSTWKNAANIYFTLRKQGITIRSPIDCCIAQIAMDHQVLLIHDDMDFDCIGSHFQLLHQRYRKA